ncbi:GNAT family N-acetyltransferase [Alkaliphilus serpentinus]|uniref:GNAT family N-acetyltransferase n=1 Tax=Alkaliphilus serpentinus TaxID=1482731 RepID=A0A833MEP2_9FIRM|nr:GNAT family N-acetyltransferase [Alkaliphilus serpentinus]KAB3531564.1 GNAT family N-acetyltransferase [Alkaliphilus serpentinus]
MKTVEKGIEYREITIEECDRIAEIDPSQFIERVWRKKEGQYKLITINYKEEGWPDGYEGYRDELIKTIEDGGAAFGAFHNDTLVAFASLNHDFFGCTAKYLLLDSMFVSKDYRGRGIGKKLVQLCRNQALDWGADKLYLCAASSEATIAFYKSIGCVEAEEINQELYESDPRDIQLEYSLR